MTIATILSKMSVVDNELDIAVGGADETRSISALDMAQDVFESIVANHPNTLGTIGTFTTTASTEYTTWPTALLRLDTLYLMNTSQTPNLPQWQIEIIQDVGGQAEGGNWPWFGALTGYAPQGFGAPRKAYTNRQYLFWAPVPDQAYTMRYYGLVAKTDITSRSQTFEYPDTVSVPMAVYATKLLSIGVADPAGELQALADEIYAPVINMLRKPTRQRPQSRQFSRIHTT